MTRKFHLAWPAWIVSILLLTLSLAGCTGNSIPPPDQFTSPPIGTPLPQGAELEPLHLPEDSSGVLFLNQSVSPIRVAVNDTITEIQVQQSFLFILPPGTHRFYVYEIKAKPLIYSEKVEKGKVRFVYYLHGGPQG